MALQWLLTSVLLYLGIAYVPQRPMVADLDCEGLELPDLPGFDVISTISTEVSNYTNAAYPDLPPLSFCNLSVTLTHGLGDRVLAQIWLPLSGWNGKFQATGGGGLAEGFFDIALAPAVAQGFASGSTDGGLGVYGPPDVMDGRWALNKDNTLNWERLVNFGYRSIHDMTTIGKAASKVFYGDAPRHSYYTGCSTGGRQGYFAAMFYPEDFDGILANAPAINMPELGTALYWPVMVMNNGRSPSQCVFSAVERASIAACDPLDGATDGLISKPSLCDFDPASLVDSQIMCDTGPVTITAEDAETATKILQGPRTASGEFLWYGLVAGASFAGQANTRTVDNRTVPAPFGAAEHWVRYMTLQDPTYNTSSLTLDDYERVHNLSLAKYSPLMGTKYPDLSNFAAAGGKLLTFHGLADPLIHPSGTTSFHDQLRKTTMGGAKAVDDFYRLFLGPGVGHCIGGYGPFPTDEFEALVAWVEHGKAPSTLPAAIVNVTDGTTITRDLCLYPSELEYVGGDVKSATSFRCK